MGVKPTNRDDRYISYISAERTTKDPQHRFKVQRCIKTERGLRLLWPAPYGIEVRRLSGELPAIVGLVFGKLPPLPGLYGLFRRGV